MIAKKYCLRPRYVRSANDGQMHFISATMLMQLYKVSSAECVVEGDYRGRSAILIDLYPRTDGKYQHPEKSDDTNPVASAGLRI